MKWINFLCIGWYDGSEYYWFDDMAEYMWFIFSQYKKNRRIYFHFGGGFDFLFILDHVFQKNSGYFFRSAIPRGSSFLSVTIEDLKGNSIQFCDSSALLPYSLKDLTKNFGVETKKGEIDHTKTKGITRKLLDYMMDDHLALWEVLDAYRSHPTVLRTGLKLTRSSIAFNLFNKFYLKKKIIPLKSTMEDFCRLAYQGGRTEIFKPLFQGNKKKRIRRYDVNSLYPDAMRKNDYPIAFDYMSNEFRTDDLSILSCRVKVPLMKIPPLGIVHNGKYVFPCGEFEWHGTNKELAMAITYGVEVLKVHKSLHFKNGGKIFKEYIEEMYQLRMESRPNSPDKTIYKDNMNHVFGRYSMRTDRYKLMLDDGSTGNIEYLNINGHRIVQQPTELKSIVFLPISVFVTSYARINNYMKYIKPYEDHIYYTDTDSFDLDIQLKTSDSLGGLKEESNEEQAVYVAPKAYMIGNKGKIKGFNKNKVKILTFEDFKNYLEGSGKISVDQGEKMLKFKESLRRNKKVLSVSSKNVKKLNKRYDKREIYYNNLKKEYDTNPLFIIE